MPAARIILLFLLLLTAGFAVTGCVALREPKQAGAKQARAVAVETPPAATRGEAAAPKLESRGEKTPASGSAGRSPAATEASPGSLEQTEAPALLPPAAKVEVPEPKTDVPSTKAPAKAAAPTVPAEKVARIEGAAPSPVRSPHLDLPLLEKRLKETNAIGVITKLTLKNQVDDLLTRFRAHYEGRARTTLAELRQPYDLLILKVLALLQDGDPSLARAIADSREAIWSILADPVKFKAL